MGQIKLHEDLPRTKIQTLHLLPKKNNNNNLDFLLLNPNYTTTTEVSDTYPTVSRFKILWTISNSTVLKQ